MNTQSNSAGQTQPGAQDPVRQPELRPRVQVFEGSQGITLWADIPGVSKESLAVHIETDTLYIEGEVRVDVPETLQELHTEMRGRRFRRSFTLSPELNADAIEASLRDGVLELRIPKRIEVRPRHIEVQPS